MAKSKKSKKSKQWAFKPFYIITIITGIVCCAVSYCINASIIECLGYLALAIYGGLGIIIDSIFDARQLKKLFNYNDELDEYKSLMDLDRDREYKSYMAWKGHVECRVKEITDIEDFYWRLKTEWNRKKNGLDNWKTILTPVLLTLIAFGLSLNEQFISTETINIETWRWILIGASIVALVVGLLINNLVNSYNLEISFLEDLMKVVDDKYHKEYHKNPSISD